MPLVSAWFQQHDQEPIPNKQLHDLQKECLSWVLPVAQHQVQACGILGVPSVKDRMVGLHVQFTQHSIALDHPIRHYLDRETSLSYHLMNPRRLADIAPLHQSLYTAVRLFYRQQYTSRKLASYIEPKCRLNNGLGADKLINLEESWIKDIGLRWRANKSFMNRKCWSKKHNFNRKCIFRCAAGNSGRQPETSVLDDLLNDGKYQEFSERYQQFERMLGVCE